MNYIYDIIRDNFETIKPVETIKDISFLYYGIFIEHERKFNFFIKLRLSTEYFTNML